MRPKEETSSIIVIYIMAIADKDSEDSLGRLLIFGFWSVVEGNKDPVIQFGFPIQMVSSGRLHELIASKPRT